ncbi:metallophosphoesterase family protein [Cognatazoarcus halotolerans]|uniref:metallophosphoesterase family protein n=1 Tax=Cognatazoarcus halotolerans TaxID=2686016 RepID=UPI001357C51B|nr:metallophosphoesterase [Cognatazoarcus halotolerans]MCB1897836.1 metallophosphoesterase [Rhodocyclaceae bacterium]MCP5311764.1 metallophosphoesterase [Zoogloeaceae bacterium]
MTVRILHLSDPHFGTERDDAVAAVRTAAQRLVPDLVVLSGDITQRARDAQFAAAGRFMASLGDAPVLAVPGNHDIPLFNLPLRLVDPFRGYRAHFGPVPPPPRHVDRIVVSGLVSCPAWRHKNGSLNPAALAGAPPGGDALFSVAVLHHPLDCRLPEDEHNLLRGAGKAVRALCGRGVDLVLGGHIHDPYVSTTAARYPDVTAPAVLALAGTCVSRRTRRGIPNSFNLIRFEHQTGAILTVERHDYDETERRFRLAASLRFVRGGCGGWSELARL